MKTKDELIKSLEETRKALINQVNKSKEEIQRKAKLLYYTTASINLRKQKIESLEYKAIKKQENKTQAKIIILKPRVCTSFRIKAMTIKPKDENNNKIKPVFTMSTNRQVYKEEKQLIKAGQQLFKNIKWLPTIKLKDKITIKRTPFTIQTSINSKDYLQSKCGFTTERIYHNQGTVNISELRQTKYETNIPEIKAKIDYIERINRRIQGARQLNHYYETQYELAIAGMKTLEQLTKYNKELQEKQELKEAKIKNLNKITEENIKNNRAKVNKIKNEIKDLKKKRQKNVEKYQNARYRAEKERHKTQYYEKGLAASTEAYNNIKNQYNRLNQYKNECYNKIQRAADRNDINLKIEGFDHYS